MASGITTNDFPTFNAEQIDAIARMIDAIRIGKAQTRSELGAVIGLGRSIVTQRVDSLVEAGLVADGEGLVQTSGRASRRLRFRAEAGAIVVCMFGALNCGVAITDLNGGIIAEEHGAWDISRGPEVSLHHFLETANGLLGRLQESQIWGVAIGLPGPVDHRTGVPVAPPLMPGWNSFDVRHWVEQRLAAPVWVDNDVNLMALGEWWAGHTERKGDLLFVKVGSGIGAGILSNGQVHRGANGSAGDIGHIAVTDEASVICRCGQTGCLEAVAGGWALARDGERAARSASSPYLARVLAKLGVVTPGDVSLGARAGDPYCVEAVARSARTVGETLASLVNFFNPSTVVVGGIVADTGDLFLAAVRHTIYSRSAPLATRDLRVLPATLEHQEGLVGGASLVREHILSPQAMLSWMPFGSPPRSPQSTWHLDTTS